MNVRKFFNRLYPLAVCVTVTLSPVGWASAGSDRVKQRESALDFESDLGDALERARAENKPVFLGFGAVWCPACRTFKETTLLEPSIQAFSEDFVWVQIDIDRNSSLARQWGIEVTPTIFLLDASGTRRHRIVGGISADRMSDILRKFLGRAEGEQENPAVIPTTTLDSTNVTSGPKGFRGHSICFSHVGYGPLSVRSQSPFQSLRLGILPRTPSTLGEGQHQIRLGTTWSNIWANDDAHSNLSQGDYGRYLLDYESLDVSLAYSYGLSDTFEVGMEYEQRWRSGGVMDGFIQGFHDLFGIDQSGRDLVDRNQFRIFVDPSDGSEPVFLGSQDRGIFAQSLLFTLQHNVTCGTKILPALSWAVSGRWSVGENDLEGSDFDIAASIAAARRFGHFYGYLTLGYAYFGGDSVYGIELERTQLTVLAALEWRFKSRMSLVVQYLGSEGVATDLPPFSKTSNEVILGWKGEIVANGVLEIGLLENILSFDNSPDFGIHAAFSRRF